MEKEEVTIIEGPQPGPQELSTLGKIKRLLIGSPKNLEDPHLFHKLSLIAFFAWVGLGSDGLSSSAYGPDEAFRALEGHTELAVFLAIATAATVFIISFSYNQIIEHFPHGGGGYVVATQLLGSSIGAVSGAALLVDYVLTITVSIAAGADQVFSFLPLSYHDMKVPLEGTVIVLLVLMNLRGVKESIGMLMPIFLLFVITHLTVFLGAFITRAGEIAPVASQVSQNLQGGLSTLGLGAMFLIFARAFSRGAGTFTGIEAVSNGLAYLREPKVETGKRTMLYMAISLSVTAGGILLCYLLLSVSPQEGKTMNAVMVERLGFGTWFVVLTLVAEAAILFLAAQTGFIGGPQVMANMAVDNWLPRRFMALSERLTMHYGVVLMGAASLLILIMTRGNITALVTMYSINVFVTFSLALLGMCRLWVRERRTNKKWKRHLSLSGAGLAMCLSILVLVTVEKFNQGGWVTLLITTGLILVCFSIRRHYHSVRKTLQNLTKTLERLARPMTGLPGTEPGKIPSEPVPAKSTAVLMVGDYGGIGIHSLLTIFRLFPGMFTQVIFVSVALINSEHFKGAKEVDRLKERTREMLDKYVTLARGYGLAAKGMMAVGTEVVSEAEKLCLEIAREYSQVTFFSGKLIFEPEKWYQRLLHNEAAYALERRLQWLGLPVVILPVRVRKLPA